MLSHEEALEYIRLRRLGRIGVLWAEGGKLYFLQRPSANGFYRRDEAEFMTAREFLGHMTRAGFCDEPWGRAGAQVRAKIEGSGMSLFCCECGGELKAFASMRTIWKKRDMTVACIDLEACKIRRDERERQARNQQGILDSSKAVR